MEFRDLIGGALASIGLLVILLILGAIAVATARNLPYAVERWRSPDRLRQQEHLYARYAEWCSTNPDTANDMSFDRWKEAHDR